MQRAKQAARHTKPVLLVTPTWPCSYDVAITIVIAHELLCICFQSTYNSRMPVSCHHRFLHDLMRDGADEGGVNTR